ncbi:MAG: RNA methyltransferase [Burkholderiales bacterium]|nr:RNA methyltransferase [Burkholderiales bacterium]
MGCLLPERAGVSDRLARVRIVLSHPTHPGNIGATARAMKTMGLTQLVLVNPKRFPDPQADALSSNALDVLGAAKVVGSLDEALAGTVLAVATVSHTYEMAPELVTCREAAARAVHDAASGDVALVFGTEANGLAVDEVLKCSLLAHIPSNPDYTSLNLAQAVQVFAYEIRIAALGDRVPDVDRAALPTFDDMQHLHAHLEEVLAGIGFFDPENPKKLLPRLRRLIAKARLDQEEVRILRGLLNSVTRVRKS